VRLEEGEHMSYKQIKWLILILPTITIGVWEYSRHAFLLPYLSMEVGNFLSPVIVFTVTIIFLLRLFSLLEKMQEELRRERAKKAALLEREKLARELHDGIAQSLFLLSVKVNKFGRQYDLESKEDFQKMKQTIQHVHEDIRQSITNLKEIPDSEEFKWRNTISRYLDELQTNYQMEVDFQWNLSEERLTTKEKVELFACIKEATINVVKHAKTDKIWILARETSSGWLCEVRDEGIGFAKETTKAHGFGLQILQSRAAEMNWVLTVQKEQQQTIVRIQKEEA